MAFSISRKIVQYHQVMLSFNLKEICVNYMPWGTEEGMKQSEALSFV